MGHFAMFVNVIVHSLSSLYCYVYYYYYYYYTRISKSFFFFHYSIHILSPLWIRVCVCARIKQTSRIYKVKYIYTIEYKHVHVHVVCARVQNGHFKYI